MDKIQLLPLLEQLFSTVTITPEISAEFKKNIPPWIVVQSPLNLNYQRILEATLDKGEASAIALAIENKDSLLIIDDLKGRKYAERIGLHVTGTLGLLVIAKQKGYVQSVKHYLEKIEATNFRLTPELRQLLLKRADEGD